MDFEKMKKFEESREKAIRTLQSTNIESFVLITERDLSDAEKTKYNVDEDDSLIIETQISTCRMKALGLLTKIQSSFLK